VQAYQDVFPRRPNHIQAEQIATKVDDLDLWRAVMRWWAANGHRAKSVGKMLNKYRQTDNAETYTETHRAGTERRERLKPRANLTTHEPRSDDPQAV